MFAESLLPAFGGGPRNQPTAAEKAACVFDATDMKQIGFMLSLRLADGSPNPVATFGQGIFDFSLDVASIEPIFGEKINKDDAKEL